MSNALQAFQEILSDKGLMPSEIVADGKLHRCPTQAKPHKQNGAYIAHLDTPATLWWCNWENGGQGTFTEVGERPLSPVEKEALQRRHAAIKLQREAEFAERQASTAQVAHNVLASAAPCSPEHQYLQRKGIPALGSTRLSLGRKPAWPGSLRFSVAALSRRPWPDVTLWPWLTTTQAAC